MSLDSFRSLIAIPNMPPLHSCDKYVLDGHIEDRISPLDLTYIPVQTETVPQIQVSSDREMAKRARLTRRCGFVLTVLNS